MAERPRVGVTGNARRWAPSWWCTWLTLRLAGAVPERISVRHAPSGRPLAALVIGGGNDISPEHYGGNLDAKVKFDPERDQLEIQLINVVLGGSLHQDVRPMRQRTHNRAGLLPTKQVRLVPDSNLAAVCGKVRLRVNSLHHQAIKDPGRGLVVVGWDLDDITQAVEYSGGRSIIGVQWHPEYLFYLPSQFALFRWLLRRAT